MVRIALIVTLMVALSPIVTDAWFWGSKKGEEEAPGPIETVTFRVGQGKKHAHHRDGNHLTLHVLTHATKI